MMRTVVDKRLHFFVLVNSQCLSPKVPTSHWVPLQGTLVLPRVQGVKGSHLGWEGLQDHSIVCRLDRIHLTWLFHVNSISAHTCSFLSFSHQLLICYPSLQILLLTTPWFCTPSNNLRARLLSSRTLCCFPALKNGPPSSASVLAGNDQIVLASLLKNLIREAGVRGWRVGGGLWTCHTASLPLTPHPTSQGFWELFSWMLLLSLLKGGVLSLTSLLPALLISLPKKCKPSFTIPR